MSEQRFQDRLEVATLHLAEGARALADAVGTLSPHPRAHKMVTTRVVDEAIARVRDLRSALHEIQLDAPRTQSSRDRHPEAKMLLSSQPALPPSLFSAVADLVFRATVYDRSGSTLGVLVGRDGAPRHLAVSAEGTWTLSIKPPSVSLLLYESAANVLRGGDLNPDGTIGYQGSSYVLEACLDATPRTARVRGC